MSEILIVEDTATVRKPIETMLRRTGHSTVSASNGKEALTAFERSRPDLILLDIGMPVLDGISFLRAVRALPYGRDIPVIMLTASAEKAKIVEVVKLGISGYFLKPRLSIPDLLQQISKALDKKALLCDERRQLESAMTTQPIQADPRVGTAEVSRQEAALPRTVATPALAASVPGPTSLHGSKAKSESAAPHVSDNPGEALRSLKPIFTRSELTERIDKCGELQGFSAAASEVIRLTGNPNCSIDQISKAIGHDHGIALKVLKMANSAVYTRGEPVDSVHRAVSRIGLSQIRQVVMNIAVVERFDGQGVEGHIHSGQFWEHAIATGIIAAEIAHSRDKKDADPAFTMGLLHDVGRLVYAAELGDQYLHVMETAAALQLPLEQVEQRMLGFNHADVMDRVFRAWKFSKQLINPIVFHHLSAGNIRATAPQETMQVATLCLANRLAHAFMLGSSGNHAIYPTHELCELLRLDPSVMTRIESTVRAQTDEMKFALLARSNAANWPQLNIETRKRLPQPFRPLFAGAAPEFDAHRIFVGQLTDQNAASAAPSVGIVHIRQARDRMAVSETFKSMEELAGVSNLPILVISPSGALEPESSLLSNRRVQMIATPFTLPRFAGAIKGLMCSSRVLAT